MHSIRNRETEPSQPPGDCHGRCAFTRTHTYTHTDSFSVPRVHRSVTRTGAYGYTGAMVTKYDLTANLFDSVCVCVCARVRKRVPA